MIRNFDIFTKRTARLIKSRQKSLFILILLFVPLYYFIFALSSKTLSYENVKNESIIDIYDDGVWYQSIGQEGFDSKRVNTEKRVRLTVDGEEKTIYSTSTVLDVVLSENEILLGKHDKVEPNIYSPVYDNMNTRIVRVNKVFEEIEEKVPFLIDYIDNSELYIGKQNLIQQGTEGKKIKVVEKEYEDGIEVSSKVVEEKIIETPINRIIEKGTKILVLDTQYGIASYYFHPRYPGENITAHNTYPMGSKLRVTNISNGKSVVVTVVDRGIHSPDRVVDLSTTAFKQIAQTWQGLAQVKVELLAN